MDDSNSDGRDDKSNAKDFQAAVGQLVVGDHESIMKKLRPFG